MIKSDLQDLLELTARLAVDLRPHKINFDLSGPAHRNVAAHALRLNAIARALQRISENECNGIERWDEKAKQRLAQWTEADQRIADRNRERLEREAALIIIRYGVETYVDDHGKHVRVEFQRDPRGAMIKFRLKSSGPVRL